MCHSKLSQNFYAWRIIQAPDYVINWIEHGVPIPLSKNIAPFELRDHSFSTKEDFLSIVKLNVYSLLITLSYVIINLLV